MWPHKYLALLWASAAQAPDIIPLGGNDAKIQMRRYFSTYVQFQSPEGRLLVKSVCSSGLTGFYWHDGAKLGAKASIPRKQLSHAAISIVHYFKEIEITYSSALSFFWGRLTFKHRRELFKLHFDRWLFGKKNLEEATRIEVLRWCHRKTVYERATQLSHWTFLSEKYGNNWIHHPQKDDLLSYYKWIMSSLASSGELKAVNNGARYSLDPKAIKTLVEFDADFERHKDSINQQRRMSKLTSALVFVGLVQVIVTVLSVKTD